MAFLVKSQAFSGPLALLLTLIENKELEITNVALSDVTDDYLKHMESGEIPSEELADFLVVAAKLMYLKSRAIMPFPDEEEEETPDQLAAQLRLYKMFADAANHIEQLLASGRRSYTRPHTVVPVVPKFFPAVNATAQDLARAFVGILKRLEPFFAIREASIEKVVSVQKRIRDIEKSMLRRARMTFGDVVRGAKSRVEVVVSFLALLELMKRQTVAVVQKTAFGEIELRRME